MAGPVSPPASRLLRESRRKPPLGFLRSGPWHLKHCSARTGRIFVSKNLAAAGETGADFGSPASPRPAATRISPSAQANRVALHAIIFSVVGSTNRGRRDTSIVIAHAPKVAKGTCSTGIDSLLPALSAFF